jgi:hypothetical protein
LGNGLEIERVGYRGHVGEGLELVGIALYYERIIFSELLGIWDYHNSHMTTSSNGELSLGMFQNQDSSRDIVSRSRWEHTFRAQDLCIRPEFLIFVVRHSTTGGRPCLEAPLPVRRKHFRLYDGSSILQSRRQRRRAEK